ncbi:MFS transporter [Montanilutibacter psychrotolerans]|uniref:Major facilitator superfamily associated domain-containing protein n=1 Tax=Montanilutibacter psychrotolerans TaxID=1327343 RepID=A0A3M8T2J0_9GAMM|nr:MFS transporter [Lysobacter psychrotolerans]RNF85340.1 hypothetical protein EER27_06145 [Lysobacter psychrotolerans]
MTPAVFRRYALFYLGYYGTLGAYTPYIGRWVASLGYGGYVVGAMLALWYGSRIFGPPLWSRLTSRSAVPGRWLVIGCLLAALGFSLFAGVANRGPMFAVMAWFGLCFNSVMPQFEAMTLSALGSRSDEYGRIRVWGSIGFLVVAGSYGWLLDRLGEAMFVWLTLPWLLLTIAAAWLHRRDGADSITVAPTTPLDDNQLDSAPVLQRPGMARLLATTLLMQLGFGPFYVFYTLHLQAQGHDGIAVGVLWAVGVLCEIIMFWQAPALVRRFGAQRLIGACLAVTALRWWLVAMAGGSLGWMALAQTSHALSFAVFHAACMRRMAELFPQRRHMVTAQGLLSAISGGTGGVLGAGLAAVAWQHGGGNLAFSAGAIAALAGLSLHLATAARAKALPAS